MRRIVLALAATLALCGCTCGLAGCGRSAEAQQERAPQRIVWVQDSLTTWIGTDNKTGVQYMLITGADGRTVIRLDNPDGTPCLADGYGKKE